MANNSAKLVHFPWKIGNGDNKSAINQSGFFSMKKGTYDYLFPLGVGADGPGDLTSEVELGDKTYYRQAYAGGPQIKCVRTAKTVTRTRSNRPSTASSEKKLILSEVGSLGSSQDTIHYTGSTYGAVTWLKSYASIAAGGGVSVKGPKGQDYLTIEAAISVPAP